FQHRLILINDIWLGLATLGFCFLNCITGLMVESIHAVIREGGAAEEPSCALAPLGPKVFLRPRCRDELSLWSVVGDAGQMCLIDFASGQSLSRPRQSVRRKFGRQFRQPSDVFYALVCNVIACC